MVQKKKAKPLITKKKEKKNSESSDSEMDTEDKAKSPVKKSASSDSEMDTEVKAKLPSKKVTNKTSKESGSSDESLSSDSEETGNQKDKNKTSKSRGAGKQEKGRSDDPLGRLKKYIRMMGINIRNYDRLLSGCKSMKSKKEKLLNVMHERGLKGNPTQEKCKKLKKRLERKKELEELDTDNIIETSGRGRRTAFSLYASKNREAEEETGLQSRRKQSRVKFVAESESESGSE